MVCARLWSMKKGAAESFSNASQAAFFIVIITLLIIFYIIFLPPAERAALLGDGPVPGSTPTISGGYDHLVGSVPFSQTIGKLTYISEATIEHDLASLMIFTETEANIIASTPQIILKNSAFDKKDYQFSFSIDPRTTENIYLSFNVLRSDGGLLVYLNGELIQEAAFQPGTPAPIKLPDHLLKRENILYFSVSSPGFAFWTMNLYELSGVQLVGEVTDDTNSLHTQRIYLSETEVEYAKDVTLEFYPDCSPQAVGPLRVTFNGETLFNGLPDCNLMNFVTVDVQLLSTGTNILSFTSSEGNYIIDQLQLEVELEDPGNPVFYFELSEDLFVTEKIDDRFCGNIDGFCPEGCEAYEDKDCCFDESSKNYWCDMRTTNPRDRCVNQVLAAYATNCPSGYEDRSGDPHEDQQGLCGDDTDGACPTGCSPTVDKDCCFIQSGNHFWCEDIPLTGVATVCTQSVTAAECNACPDGYRDEDNDRPNCPVRKNTNYYEDAELKSGVDITLEAFFTNQEYKRVDFIINGYTIPVDTYNTNVFRLINNYVHEGTNSLEIKPRKDVTISQVRVVIE